MWQTVRNVTERYNQIKTPFERRSVMQPFGKSLLKTIALVLGILTAALSPVFAQDLTVPTDLGSCDGYDNSVAFAINAYGQAAGMCYNGDMLFDPASVATVWLPEPVDFMAAGVHVLGTLPGCEYSKAVDINDKGQVIGECSGGEGCDRKAFIWLPEADYNLNAGMHPIEGLAVATRTYVLNINNEGQVVGQSYSPEGGPKGGFMWQNGVVTALTVSLQDTTPVSLNYNLGAKYLNEGGQVIGTYEATGTYTIGETVHPYTYDRSVIWQNGTATPLLNEGVFSEPVAVNNFGEVIGRYGEASDVFYYAQDGSTHLLGVDTSNQAFAGDINDAGQIVGWSSKGYEYVCDEGGELIDDVCHYNVGTGYTGQCTEFGTGEGGYYDSSIGICQVEPSMIEVPAKLWMWENDEFSDLGKFTGDHQFDILKINVYGEVAASAYFQEFYWEDENFVQDRYDYGYFWSASDELKELQTLGGSQINVFGINDEGQVAGASSTVGDTATHACVWNVQGAPAPPAAELIIDGGENPTNVGDLNVTYDNGVFNVEYILNAPWEIVETRVYIGDALPGKIAPGKFPYQEGEIEFNPYGDSVYIAAYADVRMPTGDSDKYGNPIFLYEGMWAQADNNIPIGKGSSWATCFEYELP
jgi:uncharacterized membrane protein